MSAARSGGRVQPARPGDPRQVGPYRIVGRLGASGMGVVHAGLDPAGLRVAVKVIHAAPAGDPEFRARFRREVRLSARVQGPCLVPVLAADPDTESPWLATAYAPGLTLDQHLAAHGPLTAATLYAFATGTAQALAAIHAAEVVHRDVKPQNVVLTPTGPRLLDFGIAHAADGTSVTRTGTMTGTPGWISPEHYRTGTTGPQGDVFAWGSLVAYAATGRPPFGTGAPDVVAYRVMSADPDLDGLPEPLRDITERDLAKERPRRPVDPPPRQRRERPRRLAEAGQAPERLGRTFRVARTSAVPGTAAAACAAHPGLLPRTSPRHPADARRHQQGRPVHPQPGPHPTGTRNHPHPRPGRTKTVPDLAQLTHPRRLRGRRRAHQTSLWNYSKALQQSVPRHVHLVDTAQALTSGHSQTGSARLAGHLPQASYAGIPPTSRVRG
ncbi:serine/threonine-protein kinase [Streptomyces roseirectus]|uniref:serine/threonine-protein kinase n=1 Tax=Streptomyces roseirectus TaxID=2768066 RepID=UPI003CCD7543